MVRMARRFTLALLTAAAILTLAPPAMAATGHAAQAQPGGSGWTTTAAQFRGRLGERFDWTCPSYGIAGSIWGTDVYTDDSSVCTAGVHTGTITLAGGGTVTIEMRPGEQQYTGSARNRITSSSYPAWSGSFVVVGGVSQQPGIGDGGSGWTQNARARRTWVGAQFAVGCPANGQKGNVWGTNIYTDDSSVCTAAVHAGVIELATGGQVIIEMRDGQQSYPSTTREGIKSSSYGRWDGSFVVIGSPYGNDNFTGSADGEVLVNGKPYTSGPIPYNSTVDVTKGTLRLTADAVGTVTVTGTGDDLARFTLKKSKQGPKKRPQADLVLNGGSYTGCGTAARAGASKFKKKIVRALWANGKGRFRTKGKFSSATVRGTNWLVTDRCDGTLTTVREGSVTVEDLVKDKLVTVKAPRSYLAKRLR
jgi:hypothetical protein